MLARGCYDERPLPRPSEYSNHCYIDSILFATSYNFEGIQEFKRSAGGLLSLDHLEVQKQDYSCQAIKMPSAPPIVHKSSPDVLCRILEIPVPSRPCH